MQTVQAHEAFKTVDGQFRFRYMQGVLRDGDDLYVAKWNKRTQGNVDASWLYDVRRVLTKDRGPVVKPAWIVAGSADDYYYVKKPRLLDYIEDGLEERISREVEACEIAMKNPHPNIAACYGCVDTRGRVSGICLKRYQTTLLERFNPQYLNKRAFVSSGRPLVYESLASDLDGILAAIHRLHSLGIVHNDIKSCLTRAGRSFWWTLTAAVSWESHWRKRGLGERVVGMIRKQRYHCRRTIWMLLLN